MTLARCPACQNGQRRTGQYLCGNCWGTLPATTQKALNRRDRGALTRLRALHQHIADGTPLAELTSVEELTQAQQTIT